MQAAEHAVTIRSVSPNLIECCLLADLAVVLPVAVDILAQRAALNHDVADLMDSLPALARTVRYGDVRGTDAESLRTVLHSMVVRISAGLSTCVYARSTMTAPPQLFTSSPKPSARCRC